MLRTLAAACLILLAWSLEALTPEGELFTYKDDDGTPRQMEIYFPEGHDRENAKVPGIIMFHGGSWTGGTRAQFSYLCHYFASRGLVAATVSYELAPKDRRGLDFEGSYKRVCIIDAKSAIRWYKQHAPELGIDPDRIIAGGGSAGGHIALLATTNPGLNDPEDNKAIDTSVVAYLLFNPAVIIETDSEVNLLDHIGNDCPPAIMFWGTNDPWLERWNPVYAEIKSRGIKSFQYWEAQDQPHSFFNKQPWLDITITQADKFLVEQGLLRGDPTLPAPETGEMLIRKE